MAELRQEEMLCGLSQAIDRSAVGTVQARRNQDYPGGTLAAPYLMGTLCNLTYMFGLDPYRA
jgi:hypothetical protein